MKQLIQDFTQHLKKALEINASTTLSAPTKPINNVLICGLGGSGIGATIINQIVSDDANCPIVVNKDYFIPNFVGENTLVIACSYSGNTEETLEMVSQAEQKKAIITCVTSGGKLAAISIEKKL
jgi:glucose/mannose-6-phosphate isomerase